MELTFEEFLWIELISRWDQRIDEDFQEEM